MRLFSALQLATILVLIAGLNHADGAPSPSSRTATIIYTNGLGTILRDPFGADRSRCQTMAQRLKDLRAKYSDAIFVDGGDAIGPMAGNESPYGLPVYRIFDENRYAAAALSTRDGIQTFSFFQLLPAGATVKTPLVGGFDHPKPPPGSAPYYEIHPRWAIVETPGAKFQIFGVATTTSLSGVIGPLSDIKTGGTAAKQAQYVLDHLLPGHLPIILSDMAPAENNEFALLINRNALLFEGCNPWRLVGSLISDNASREVGPVRILSHQSPYLADVVTIPPSLECRQARLVDSEQLWEPPQKPSSGGFRLWGQKPIEERLVRSLLTENLLYLPDVGTSVARRSLLEEINIPYDDKDVKREPPPGATGWRAPRWMEKTQNLRGNGIVYRYDLYFKSNYMASVYRVRHFLALPYSVFDMLVAVNKDHRIRQIQVFFPPAIANRAINIESVCQRLVDKKCDEIRLGDWPERGGAEFVVDNFVRDLQMLLAFDEAAR